MNRIPKILHFVFGLSADFGGKPWSLLHHVCLMSAIHKLKPKEVNFYYCHLPTGPWFELSRRELNLIKIDPPTEIFGNPLLHVAHKADIIRLEVLSRYGGIYLDADVFVQKSFDDLLENSVVMGLQKDGQEEGLANAVILAEQNAPFLDRWMSQYVSFRSLGRDEYWDEHSVKIPYQLSRQFPKDVTVLEELAFYWPTWSRSHLNLIFRGGMPSINQSDCYANHLWETYAWDRIWNLTPGSLRKTDSNFSRWAQPFLEGLPDDYGAISYSNQIKIYLGMVRAKIYRRIKRSIKISDA